MGKADCHVPMGILLKGGSTKCPPVGAFPIVRQNSYGRMMISAQMNTHERLITNATARTESEVSERSLHQMVLNRKMEKWKPGFNELHEKATNDRILARMIATATHQSDERLGAHVERFRRNRNKNPRFKPSWLESYGLGKGMAVHEELLAKTQARVDSGPPAKAMQFRNFLRKCQYTSGGFPRQDTNRRSRSVNKLPPMGDSPPGVSPPLSPSEMDELNEDLQTKYSQMLFDTQMFGATNDDVRLLYAQCNKLPVDEDLFHKATVAARNTHQTKPLTASVTSSLHRQSARKLGITPPGMGRRIATMPLPDQENPFPVRRTSSEKRTDEVIDALKAQLTMALADWKVSESEEDITMNRQRVWDAKASLRAMEGTCASQQAATMSYRKSSGVSVHNSFI